MSDINSNPLFSLIKSLNMSEKRHFKIFASRHIIGGDENNYVKLFDAIDKQKKYDEQKLLQKEKFNQLSLQKNRLYEIILKSLRTYHTNLSVNTELKGIVHNVEILFTKGLYEQCEKMIAKGKKIANKYEMYLHLLELFKWEFKLMQIQVYFERTEEELGFFFNEINDNINKYKNINEYIRLSIPMFMKIKKEKEVRNQDQLLFYDEIIKHPLLDNEKRALSFEAKFHFYNCSSAYFYQKNNLEKAYFYIQKLINLFEVSPHQIAENTGKYVAVLHNQIINQSFLKKYDEAALSIQKLKGINTKAEGLRNRIFFSANNLELQLYATTGEFGKGLNLIFEIQNELDKPNARILNKENKIVLYHAISCIYFGAGDYSKANFYINKILNNPLQNIREDLYCFSKIISLLIHYELGNLDLLRYTVKSTYRYLYKKNRLYQFETIFLHFIKERVRNTESKKELIETFKELKKELELLIEDSFEKKALDYFDFISWLESKIENKPFAEIVRGKAIMDRL